MKIHEPDALARLVRRATRSSAPRPLHARRSPCPAAQRPRRRRHRGRRPAHPPAPRAAHRDDAPPAREHPRRGRARRRAVGVGGRDLRPLRLRRRRADAELARAAPAGPARRAARRPGGAARRRRRASTSRRCARSSPASRRRGRGCSRGPARGGTSGCYDAESDREGATALRAVVGDDGATRSTPSSRKWDDDGPAAEVVIREVVDHLARRPRRDLGLPARPRPHAHGHLGARPVRRAAVARARRPARAAPHALGRALGPARRRPRRALRAHLREPTPTWSSRSATRSARGTRAATS